MPCDPTPDWQPSGSLSKLEAGGAGVTLLTTIVLIQKVSVRGDR
jgi:hypothetical protein